MGYDFHLARLNPVEESEACPRPDSDHREKFYEALIGRGFRFSLAEWKDAVHATEGVRLRDSDRLTGRNPRTGEKLSVTVGPASVEVLHPDGEWHYAFRFSQGTASFRGLDWTPSEPIAVAASRLARALGAKVFGDEGEVYELLESPAT